MALPFLRPLISLMVFRTFLPKGIINTKLRP
jgi:hypothetical protein